MSGAARASLSLDLDNLWSYLMIHGDPDWQDHPSYLSTAVPRILDFLDERDLTITIFLVGQDAVLEGHDEVMEMIGSSRHRIGNHSFHHEPWLSRYSRKELRDELSRAHDAIATATGREPAGFRGPGFSLSGPALRTLSELGYRYDASTLPTFIGPLARRYYFAKSDMAPEEQRRRDGLFGSFSDGLLPLKPYRWDVGSPGLIEVPVTTMPVTRLPFHFSYLLYLSGYSDRVARGYLRSALSLCGARGLGPSMLLHPLDYLGPDDVRTLAFFPGMDISAQEKVDRLHRFLDLVESRFAVGTIESQLDELGLPERTRRLPSASPGAL